MLAFVPGQQINGKQQTRYSRNNY